MPAHRKESPLRRRENTRLCYCPRCIGNNKRITTTRWQEHQDAEQARIDLILLGQQDILQPEIDVNPGLAVELEIGSEADFTSFPGRGNDEGLQEEVVGDLHNYCASSHSSEPANELQETADSNLRHDNMEDNWESEVEETEAEELEDESNLELEGFENQIDLHNLEDIDSWNITDPELEDAIKWYIWKVERRVSDNAFSSRPHATRYTLIRIKKSLRQLTGLSSRRITCCINVCAAFMTDEQECPHCNEPIYEDVPGSEHLKRPRKQAFYFCPIPRLVLEYALSDNSREMQEYVAYCLRHDSETRIDFWNSDHFRRLRSESFFEDIRDTCLSYSTDGVSITRQRDHSVDPGCLTIHNLKPEVRFRRMMIVLLIPGPREAKDMGSFHQPLIQSLKRLSEDGVSAYDGWKKEVFTLRAHLCFLHGDFPAMAKMTGLLGANGKSPCRFCHILGCYDHQARHMYYPLNSRLLVSKPFAPADEQTEIPLRRDMRQNILQVVAANNKQIAKDYGVKSLSWFFNISTLHFPDSFGLDAMHLFSNVAKHMWALWSGATLRPEYEDNASTPSYVLTTAQQEAIGFDMKTGSRGIPVSVSRTPRDISKHKGSFKATEWFEFILIYSTPLLMGRLPDYALESWTHFVKAVRLALKVELTLSEISTLDEHFRLFVLTTETIYYQGISHRLPVCTSQLHSLLHVAANIRALGPVYLYWQFGMERYIGGLEHLASSKSQMDASIFNGLDSTEQLKYVRLLYRLDSSFTVSDTRRSEISRGGLLLGYFLGSKTSFRLSGRVFTLVKHYYRDRYESEVDVSAISSQAQKWSQFRREVSVGTMHSFQVTASKVVRNKANSRCRSYVAYTVGTDRGLATEYGEVLVFLEHNCSKGIHHFALIQRFNLVMDETSHVECYQFRTGSRPGRMILIEVGSITEPVGLLKSSAGEDPRHRKTYLTFGNRALISVS